jgi:hypothetical protein
MPETKNAEIGRLLALLLLDVVPPAVVLLLDVVPPAVVLLLDVVPPPVLLLDGEQHGTFAQNVVQEAPAPGLEVAALKWSDLAL